MEKETSFNYEKALIEIQQIVDTIEKGESKVDELTSLVQKALDLINQCKLHLKNTENNIQQLFDENEND